MLTQNGSKFKMLIVDDSELDRQLLNEIFKDEFDIMQAENGYEAIGLAIANARDMAVVLLDINMPMLNGIETLKQIRKVENCELVPVVLITAEALRETLKAGYENGMADYIVKPIDRYSVYQRIMNIAELYEAKRIWHRTGAGNN